MRVVGLDNSGFFKIRIAITAGFQLECNESLATGRDIPRERGRRAPSAGFDARDF